MNFVEVVLHEKQAKGLSNAYIAEQVGFTRQRLEGIFESGDCYVGTAVKMLDAVGKALVIKPIDEKGEQFITQVFDTDAEETGTLPDTVKTLASNRIMYSAAEEIIATVGLEFDIMDKAEVEAASYGAPEEEKS